MTVYARRPSRLLSFAGLVLLAVGALIAVPQAVLASRSASVARSLDYFHAVQGSSGQFQDPAYTPWVIIAIAASGENPDGGAWKRKGKSPLDYLQGLDLASYATQGAIGNAPAYYAKMILAYVAAGHRSDITSAGTGRVNLVGKLLSFQRGDGRFCPSSSAPSIAAVNTTTWAIIALCAAQTNQSSVSGAIAWLRAQQLADGGFSSNAKDAAVGLPSDVDDTCAAIEALVAGGVSTGADVLRNARAYLKGAQRSDGGFSSGANGSYTYSESTAWAMQAILALGENPTSSAWSHNGKTPQDALTALQAANGAFEHKRGVVSLPLLSTTQSLTALAGRSFAFFPRGGAAWVTPFVATPRILRFSPEAHAAVRSSTVTVQISYRDSPGGTGTFASGVRLIVDGRDMTRQAKIGTASLSMRLTHLAAGRHTIKLTVRDRAGNAQIAIHTFMVSGTAPSKRGDDTTEAGGGGGGSATPSITSHGAGSEGGTQTGGAAAATSPAAAASPEPGGQSATASAVSPRSSPRFDWHQALLFFIAVVLLPLGVGFGFVWCFRRL